MSIASQTAAASGREIRHAAAGPPRPATDAALPRTIPLGTHLVTRKRALAYVRNGTRVDDFPLAFYGAILGIGGGFFLWAVLQWMRKPPIP